MKRKITAVLLVVALVLSFGVMPAFAVEPVGVVVAVDIKPQSCPNPINVDGKGVLPVAILGMEDFDVAMVDPDTVLLEGVPPLRWALEDVATPYLADFGGCHELGPDGLLDLTLKFNMQEIVGALDGVPHGDVLMLTLTGSLLDGTPIMGEDQVVIRAR